MARMKCPETNLHISRNLINDRGGIAMTVK